MSYISLIAILIVSTLFIFNDQIAMVLVNFTLLFSLLPRA